MNPDLTGSRPRRSKEKCVIEQYIRDVPDFPKPGIVYKDITPLLGNAQALGLTIDRLSEAFSKTDYDVIAGIESRGFIFGTALANQVGKGFVPIRKPGKLPHKTASQSYDLEYGSDTLEIHMDAVEGQRVLIIDDLLATGGTLGAAVELINKVGGTTVGCGVVIELEFLAGRERLGATPVTSLIRY
jgi:adenine phosphoribosyltransferase